jgi:hypothetical protein
MSQWPGQSLIESIIRPRLTATATKPLADANCWARDLPLGCAPRGSTNGSAIMPNCTVHAAHFALDGSAVRNFVDSEGITHARTTSGYKSAMALATTKPDIGVCKLNTPLPATVRMPRILPPDWRALIPNNGAGLLAVTVDFEDKAIVHQVQTLDNGAGKFVLVKPTDTAIAAFWEQAITGDSSSPAYLILPNQVIFIGCVTSAATGNCSGLAAERAYWPIANAMQRLGDFDAPRYAMIDNLSTPLDGWPLIGSPVPPALSPYPTLPTSGHAYYVAKNGLKNGDVVDAGGAVFGGPFDVGLLGDGLLLAGNQELSSTTHRRVVAGNNTDSTVMAVLTIPGGTPKENWLCRFDGANGQVTIQVDSANGTYAFIAIGNERINFIPQRGMRMLVCGRRNGATMNGTVGTQVKTRTDCKITSDPSLTWKCAIIGGTGGHTQNYFSGSIEAFAIWPRALTDAEVSAVRMAWKV